MYESPFGKGKFGSDSSLVRQLGGGWQLSNIATYASGAPLVITYAGCNAPNAGQYMPDLNPNYVGSPCRNGHYGQEATAASLGTYSYIDPAGFQAPATFGVGASPISKMGTAPLATPLMGSADPAARTFGTVGSASGNRDFQFAGRINF